jgi:hypothetical protein
MTTTRRDRQRFEWHGDVLLGADRKPLLRIVPDAKWPGMWRVEFPDGRLSDLTNRTRAKDAATLHAVHLIFDALAPGQASSSTRSKPVEGVEISPAPQSAPTAACGAVSTMSTPKKRDWAAIKRRQRAKVNGPAA